MAFIIIKGKQNYILIKGDCLFRIVFIIKMIEIRLETTIVNQW